MIPTAILQSIIAALVPQLEECIIAEVKKRIAEAFDKPAGAKPKGGITTAQLSPFARSVDRAARAAYNPTVRKNGLMPMKPTPALMAARKAQGQYLGALRRLKGKDRAQVKAAQKSLGYTAALKLAAKLAPKAA